MPTKSLEIEPADLWRILKASGIKYVKFIIVDMNGAPRSEIVPIDMAKDLFIDGMPFDASSIPSYSTVNRSDFVAYVDPRAVYIEYWQDGKVADVFTMVSDIAINHHRSTQGESLTMYWKRSDRRAMSS